MKLLEEMIIKYGKVYPNDVLKIDSFLNHQIDIKLMFEIGKEFKRIFNDCKPDKILTIEASGIGIATAVSTYFDYCPVVFAKKDRALNMFNETYQSKEISYTRGSTKLIEVSREYLSENDNILIIDDFLANGEALNSLLDICRQAKCNVLGCGIVVCKTYQPGLKRIEKLGYRVECLAKIKSMDNGEIYFE
ncbi:MAG: xanthine phosphoribosyltransferase [Erysipelotrichaceae bacterium]|nr:xanthine phosphoribosyltransferase [Erysipelotrichaceae bacterium]